MPGPQIDTTQVTEDLARVRAIVDRADRLQYQADNFSDRTEFVDALHSCERTEERQRVLLDYFLKTVPIIGQGTKAHEKLVASVLATFEPEWDVERDKSGAAV